MDDYDKHIGELLNYSDNEELILESWAMLEPLFQFCTGMDSNTKIGCLTQIRSGNYISERFTDEIRTDERIHLSEYDLISDIIKVETYEEVVNILSPYAEWHRKLDYELSRMDTSYRIFSMERKYTNELEI